MFGGEWMSDRRRTPSDGLSQPYFESFRIAMTAAMTRVIDLWVGGNRVLMKTIRMTNIQTNINTASPLSGIKSLNYLDHRLAWEEACSRDFDEAVMLNERGEIASAAKANLFWVNNGTVHTPMLNTGAMSGVTRNCVIELAAKHFVPLVEGVYEMTDLTDADEIFITSSALGVAPVTTFDFRRYAVETGSVTSILREAFRKRVASESH